MSTFQFTRRTQALALDDYGRNVWRVVEKKVETQPQQTALILCDLWDDHYCDAAVDRLEEMLPRIAEVVDAARRRGALIVHAPSNTMEVYTDNPARKRAIDAPSVEPPADRQRADPPLPVDGAPETCCDTPGCKPERSYTRQHEAVVIDSERDVICDDGRVCLNVFNQFGIKHVIILGVHTNMCIMLRSFGIKQLVRWGVDVALVRDLTDTLYNPATWPYVPHEEGTRLVVEFIEKFWCPTIDSHDLIG